jgi:hypothetical protein
MKLSFGLIFRDFDFRSIRVMNIYKYTYVQLVIHCHSIISLKRTPNGLIMIIFPPIHPLII